MKANEKRILIIVLYRMPDGSNQGNYMVKVQIDKVGKEVKTIKKHRAEILKDLTNYITNQKAEAVILAGNMIENVYSQEIEQFLIINRLMNVNEVMNGLIDSENRDSTYKYGLLAIDIVTNVNKLNRVCR